MSQILKLHSAAFVVGVTTVNLLWIAAPTSAADQSSTNKSSASNSANVIFQPARTPPAAATQANLPLPETGRLAWQSNSESPKPTDSNTNRTAPNDQESSPVLKWRPAGAKAGQTANNAISTATSSTPIQKRVASPLPIRQPNRERAVTQPKPVEQVKFTPPPNFRGVERQLPSRPASAASQKAVALTQRGRKLVNYRSQQPTSKMQSPELPAPERQFSLAASKPLPRPIQAQKMAQSDRVVTRIEPLPGWQAVGAEVSQRIARSETLMQRNAFFSAREEASGAMNYLANILDAGSNSLRSHSALQAAQTAIQEAENFASGSIHLDHEGLKLLVSSHATTVLKDVDVRSLTPMTAVQHYHRFAKEKLVDAAQQHPWCSEVLYALGRSFQAQSESAPTSGVMLQEKSLVYYRAALEIAPGNTLAANQLGYMLLRMDRAEEARGVLIQSIQATPTQPAVQNLAEAARRLGDQQVLNWVAGYLQQNNAPATTQSSTPMVTQVSPDAFIALSPYNSGPTAR